MKPMSALLLEEHSPYRRRHKLAGDDRSRLEPVGKWLDPERSICQLTRSRPSPHRATVQEW